MDGDTLEERYLAWLYGQVASLKDRVRTRRYWGLLSQIHQTIFVAVVNHDENRFGDCRDLRYEYLAEHTDEAGDPDFTGSPASMLELLIVLSRHLQFEMDDDARVWFWHLIEVLHLRRYNDRVYDEEAEEVVQETLDRVIWRTYEPDGQGGLFPLQRPHEDMREVELWYQLNAYLLENF